MRDIIVGKSISSNILVTIIKTDDGVSSVSTVVEGYFEASNARKLVMTSDSVLHCVYNRIEGGYSQMCHGYLTDNGESRHEEP